jgi:hypothetical protein
MSLESQAEINAFWLSLGDKKKPTQLQRYQARGAPDCIKRFIEIGGGPAMGTTLEKYARFHFKGLKKRKTGEGQTGYDHLLSLPEKEIFLEQKSSGHWGEDDYKWQHVEEKHMWTVLLLCGIDYTCVKFWGMNRTTFNRLIAEKKITNQGNNAGDSSEGVWFNYSDVKDSLIEIQNDQALLEFVKDL